MGILAVRAAARGGAVGAANPRSISPHYFGLWLGGQLTGNVIDRSGKGRDGTPQAGLTDSEMWAAAPAFSTVTDDTNGVTLGAAGALDWDMALGDSLLLSYNVKKDAIAATNLYLGDAWNTTHRGIMVSSQTTNRLGVWVSDGAGTTGSSSSTIVVHNGAWHNVQIAIDGTTKLGSVWVDGVQDLTLTNVDFSARSASTNGTLVFTLGNVAARTGAACHAAQFTCLHILVYKYPFLLPTDLAGTLRQLRTQPTVPLEY